MTGLQGLWWFCVAFSLGGLAPIESVRDFFHVSAQELLVSYSIHVREQYLKQNVLLYYLQKTVVFTEMVHFYDTICIIK